MIKKKKIVPPHKKRKQFWNVDNLHPKRIEFSSKRDIADDFGVIQSIILNLKKARPRLRN